ncbi:hypothetical protein FQZ97_769640 [compost metagenome]
MAGRDIAHGHRSAQAGAEAAAGDTADDGAVGVDDLGAFAHRYALLGQQADALARYALTLLGEHALRAGEAAGPCAIGAAGLGDGPGQAGLDRRGGRAHVMAVEAQAGFQAQRVAGAEADGPDLRLGQQRTGQGFGLGHRHGDLVAVFAGVAGAADEALHAFQAHAGELHEGHLLHFRRQAAEHLGGLGPLQGQQGAGLEQRFDLALAGQVLAQMGQVLVLAGGVDHQEQLVLGQAGDHQVVEDAALGVGEQRVALGAHRQVEDVHRHQAFQRPGRIGAAQDDLAHVRDVEQAGLLTGVQVLLEHAERVLHRHVVAGEGHHARAEFEVQGMQRGLGEGFGSHAILSGRVRRAHR